MVVFTLVFGWAAISITIRLKTYATFALIEVSDKSHGASQQLDFAGNAFAQAEIEFISSEVFLQKVIGALNLNVIWAKKYFNGETLKTRESMQILKQRIMIRPTRTTRTTRGISLIEVHAYSDHEDDAVALANSLATIYLDCVATDSRDVTAQIIKNAQMSLAEVRPKKILELTAGAVTGCVVGFIVAGAMAAFIYIRKLRYPTRDAY